MTMTNTVGTHNYYIYYHKLKPDFNCEVNRRRDATQRQLSKKCQTKAKHMAAGWELKDRAPQIYG